VIVLVAWRLLCKITPPPSFFTYYVYLYGTMGLWPIRWSSLASNMQCQKPSAMGLTEASCQQPWNAKGKVQWQVPVVSQKLIVRNEHTTHTGYGWMDGADRSNRPTTCMRGSPWPFACSSIWWALQTAPASIQAQWTRDTAKSLRLLLPTALSAPDWLVLCCATCLQS
jgi:hypothetical protein